LNDQEFSELLRKITKETLKKIDDIFNKLGNDIDIIDVEAVVESE